MTSRDLERSRPWPRYIWASISQNPLQIEYQYQWSTYRKWGVGNRMVTWPMTSRDLERSRPWPRYIWGSISQNPLEIECQYRWNTYGKLPMGKRSVTWPMTSRGLERYRSRLKRTWGLCLMFRNPAAIGHMLHPTERTVVSRKLKLMRITEWLQISLRWFIVCRVRWRLFIWMHHTRRRQMWLILLPWILV